MTHDPHSCVGCAEDIDQDTVPHFISDDDGSGEGKPEVWCPQCFVWHRAPLSTIPTLLPNGRVVERPRFDPGSLVAIKCRCGKTSVVSASLQSRLHRCNQCGGMTSVVLGPKTGADAKLAIQKAIDSLSAKERAAMEELMDKVKSAK